jgi:hypothetical protein
MAPTTAPTPSKLKVNVMDSTPHAERRKEEEEEEDCSRNSRANGYKTAPAAFLFIYFFH